MNTNVLKTHAIKLFKIMLPYDINLMYKQVVMRVKPYHSLQKYFQINKLGV